MTIRDVQDSRKRLEGLDALRGAAILLVMIGHFVPETFPKFHEALIASFAGAGVLLFFYLSGFLIFRSVRVQPPMVFLIRRFFKLFPAYWMNILVITLMAVIAGIGAVPDARTLIANGLMIQEWTRSPLINNVFWTLQIEVKFYLVMVVFHRCFGERWIYALLALLLATNVALWPFMHRGSTLITYLVAFFPGIVAAKLSPHGWTRRAFGEMAAVTTLVALNLLFLQYNGLAQCVYAMIFSAALVAAVTVEFSVPLLSFLAKISYSHYLYHAAIGYAVIAAISKSGSFNAEMISLLTATVVTVGVSTLSFYGLEKPGIALGRRLEGSLPCVSTKAINDLPNEEDLVQRNSTHPQS